MYDTQKKLLLAMLNQLPADTPQDVRQQHINRIMFSTNYQTLKEINALQKGYKSITSNKR